MNNLEIDSCLLDQNTAGVSGGGMATTNSSLNFTNNVVTNNTGIIGGGIRYMTYVPEFKETWNISNNYSGNTAEFYG